MRLALVVAIVAVFSLAGCTNDGNAGENGTCTPGEAVACTCADGAESQATCLEDGTPGSCDCDGQGGAGGTGGSGGTGGEGGTGGDGGTGGGDPIAHRWVTDSIVFPTNESVGVDLDGDGTIDNALAKSIGRASAFGFEIPIGGRWRAAS